MDKKEFNNYQPLQELSVDGTLLKHVGYKPVMGSVFFLAVGGICTFAGKGVVRIFGILLIAAGFFALVLYRDHTVLDIYSGGILFIDDHDSGNGAFIPFEKIRQWNVQRSENRTMVFLFVLNDGTYIYKETFQPRRVERILERYLPERKYTGHSREARI